MIKVEERSDNALADGIEKGLCRNWNREFIKEYSKRFSLEKYTEVYLNDYSKALTHGGYMSVAKTFDFLAIQRKQGFKILSYVGNITDNKNQIELINQMPRLDGNKIIAVLVGREVDNNNVRNCIIANNLGEKVILAGFCSEMDSVWENVDLNLLLSKNDGFGLSVIEGYLRGVPSIMRESLDAYSDVNGVGVFGLSDIDDLASLIVRTDVEIDYLTIIKASKRFSLDHMKDRYIETFKKVV